MSKDSDPKPLGGKPKRGRPYRRVPTKPSPWHLRMIDKALKMLREGRKNRAENKLNDTMNERE